MIDWSIMLFWNLSRTRASGAVPGDRPTIFIKVLE
jgi:hypothetical protein